MAKRKKKSRTVRRAAVVARRAAKFARRAVKRPERKDMLAPVVAAATGAGFAVLAAKKPELAAVKGVPTPLVAGVVATVLGTVVKQTSGGRTGKVLRDVGSAGLAVGAFQFTGARMGAVAVSGDPSIVGDDDGVGYDDDED